MQPDNPIPQPSRGPTGIVPPGTPEQNPNVITPQISPPAPPGIPQAPPAGPAGPAPMPPPQAPPAPPQTPPAPPEPGAVIGQPGPVIGQPGPIIGQPGPVPSVGQMPPGQPMAPAASLALPSQGRSKQLLIALACLVGVLVAAFIVFKVLFNHPITRDQVNTALTTAGNFNDDVFEATNDINKAQDAASASAVNPDIDAANGKLDDAEKEFATLKKSNVLSDKDTNAAFKTLDGKWGPYLSYLRGSASDSKSMMPLFLDFSTKVDKLNKADVNTRSQLSSYLSQFKSIVDTTSQKLDAVKPVIPEDKDLLDAFKEDLDSSSSVIAKASKDLAAGKQAYVVENDILGIFDAQDNFYNKIDKITTKLDDKEKKLKPDKAYNDFTEALDKLLTKVNK